MSPKILIISGFLLLPLFAGCKRESDEVIDASKSADLGGTVAAPPAPVSGPAQGTTQTPNISPTPSPMPPSPVPPTTVIGETQASTLSYTFDTQLADSRCPMLKGIKQDATTFEVSHGPIGDDVFRGSSSTVAQACIISGIIKLPAGTMINLDYASLVVDSEAYLFKDDVFLINYNLGFSMNGDRYFKTLQGRAVGELYNFSKLNLTAKSTLLMDCTKASTQDQSIPFSLAIGYQINTQTSPNNADTSGDRITNSPKIQLIAKKCP